MRYVIDRIEGPIAVCEGPDRTMHNLPLDDLPVGIKDGDIIEDTGTRFVLVDNSDERKSTKEMMDSLFK